MSNFLKIAQGQRGAVPLILILLVLVGIAVGIYLVVSGTGFFPSAQETYQIEIQTTDTPAGAVPNTYIDR